MLSKWNKTVLKKKKQYFNDSKDRVVNKHDKHDILYVYNIIWYIIAKKKGKQKEVCGTLNSAYVSRMWQSSHIDTRPR